ncbi:SCF E3 ubiquitin ligase complex F-box protein grrA [Ceratocystis fimbriata CBS 114723]|uniref:SCF E3 ubiquitin ligase complex F-box protein grrA n=1 Tax=Ceratocystis fimbriata CBS 114723 TaxID=1035309 RepID=A0A2C5X576_9PEZI|nr:SCF E3 ubiquitin ligase complex F-box protein grrA [Ceratocystis fimbriata CBS 114723]
MSTVNLDGSGFDAPLTLETESSVSSAASPVPPDNDESDFYLINNDSGSSLSLSHEEREEREIARIQQECKETPVHRLPNEVMMMIFAKLDRPSDILRSMLACKRWARNSVDLLWHRPSCTSFEKMERICNALHAQIPFFQYWDYVRRINLSQIAKLVNDGTIDSLKKCNRIERLTLTNCKQVTDSGLISLVSQNHNMLALDISANQAITDQSILTVAENCPRLQGLNIAGCVNVTSQSLVTLANSCRQIKRIKLNDILNVTDEAVLAFAENCPNLLEIDLQMCHEVGNISVAALLSKGKALRELRLPYLHLITDNAFLPIPSKVTFDALRILDLTGCYELTDAAVVKIIDAAPRLRNVVLAKCRNITNVAVTAISKLGKNLHYVHLGHCSLITDEGARQLITSCNRIRYIDLGCCTALTDASVCLLANLPKLKRIGLVKCSQITDNTINSIALACNNRANRPNSDGTSGACLERVHLSHCMSLTLKSIIRLLNSCRRLTHLSLTGVPAFLTDDFQRFGRDPPPEFTEHQRQIFCVFSGNCVSHLRNHLNNSPQYEELRRNAGIYRSHGNGLFEVGSIAQIQEAQAPAPAPTVQNGILLEPDAWEPDLDEDDLMNDIDGPGGNEGGIGLMDMHQLQQNLPVIDNAHNHITAPVNPDVDHGHLVADPVALDNNNPHNTQLLAENPHNQELIYNYFVSQIQAGLMPMPQPGEATYNLITIHEQNIAIQAAQMAAGNNMLNHAQNYENSQSSQVAHMPPPNAPSHSSLEPQILNQSVVHANNLHLAHAQAQFQAQVQAHAQAAAPAAAPTHPQDPVLKMHP